MIREIIFACVLSFGGFGVMSWGGLLKKEPFLSSVLFLPVGVSIYTFGSALTYAVGINRPEIGLSLMVAIALLSLCKTTMERKVGFFDFQVFLYSVFLITVLMLLLRFLVAPILTYDSYQIVVIGQAFGSSIFTFDLRGLVSYPFMITNFQAGGEIFSLDYVAYLPVVTGLLAVVGATKVISSLISSSKRQESLCLFATFITMAVFGAVTYMIRSQLGYLNSHMLMAGYYSLGFALCLDIGRRSKSSIPQSLCALILGSVAFIRLEGLLLLSLLVIALMSFKAYSKRDILHIGSIVLLVPGLWYLRLAIAGASGSTIISPRNTVLMLLIVASPFIINILPVSRRVSTWMPSLVVIGLAGILSLYLLTEEKAVESTLVFLSNTIATGYWGAFWWTFGPLVVLLAILGPRIRSEGAWLAVLGGGLLLILLLGSIRTDPYRTGWGDSGNRMLVHLAPLAVLYTLVKVLACFEGRDGPTNETQGKLNGSVGSQEEAIS